MPWTTTTTRSSGYSMVAATWNNEVVNNMQYLEEVAYTEFTADVTTTATTVGTAVQIVSAGAVTYEAVPHLIEFECTRISPGAAQTFLIVRDSTTVLGTMGWWAASGTGAPVRRTYRVTPTAASHTYNVAGWLAAAGTSIFESGTGGTAGDGTTVLPGFIRVSRVPT